MKVGRWVLTVYAYLGLIVPLIVGIALFNDIFALWIYSISLFVFLGFFAHLVARQYRNSTGKGTFVWVITFPAFLAPFIVLFALFLAFKFIDLVLWTMTDRHLLSECIAFIWNCCVGKKSKKNVAPAQNGNVGAEQPVYYINVGGYRRRLTFYEQRNDYSLPNNPIYNRYRDDYGYFYRSYDGNKNFISEISLRERGHKDIEL